MKLFHTCEELQTNFKGNNMFGFTGPTQFDLRFSLIGIPVGVHPSFWILGVFLGWGYVTLPDFGPLYIVDMTACVFVSVLIHEMGHAVFAKVFGWPPQIFLYHMGGFAVYQPLSGHTTGKKITISFAGPAAGFVLYGIVFVSEWLLYYSPAPLHLKLNLPETAARHLWFLVQQLKWINLWWGLFNLIPVLPLDGGHICEALCEKFNEYRGKELAIKISLVISGIAAAYFFTSGHRYPGFMFAYLCYMNYNSLQRAQQGYW